MSISEENLIYDWNIVCDPNGPKAPPRLIDHTLASARLTSWLEMPDLEGQKALLSQLERLGLHHLCLGSWSDAQVRKLVETSRELEIQAWAEAPPGPLPKAPLGAYLSHRHKGWQERAQQVNGPATLVIQDISRRTPTEIAALLGELRDTPVASVCLSDDGGRATPAGTARIVTFVADALERLQFPLEIEWSGRNDRGLALANALSAWKAGAGALHCAFFSLGEGCGLVATEQLLVNLSLAGSVKRELRSLAEVSQELAQTLNIEIYPNLPVIGVDAFRTGTGVHAAAILKAQKKGHEWLADLIYSGVPAAQFGFRQIIEIGPMAGASNVHYWLEQHGLEIGPDLVQAILARAKGSMKVLLDEEIREVIEQQAAKVKG
ncbi:MAG: hypothetical protein KF760_02135 [Candidatus Eremiobacteraeota bacterium]|nr:hypothetical protein [Candidatus Eremiobacteraeota bacterium]MCW5870665.1 hypothetical protein [Candidatus Eremiobacteraeota bacterium]